MSIAPLSLDPFDVVWTRDRALRDLPAIKKLVASDKHQFIRATANTPPEATRFRGHYFRPSELRDIGGRGVCMQGRDARRRGLAALRRFRECASPLLGSL